MENNVSLCISAIFLLDSFHYHPLYCTVIPCFISDTSVSKTCCNLLHALFQMLGRCRGRQDQLRTVMEMCEGGHCCAGAAEHGEGNALFPGDCCWYNVLHLLLLMWLGYRLGCRFTVPL